MGTDATSRVARAFAPGHITGFFRPDLSARDPRGRGSVGAGVVLDRGAWATAWWSPGGRDGLALRSRPRIPLPISRAVARHLKGSTRGRLEVDLSHDLPVGQGLGMSAAGAVATGLAVAAAMRIPASRAWQWAHLAELAGRGGLGGVAAIGGGGWERRIRPGLAPWGATVHSAATAPLRLVPIGRPMPSREILSDPGRLGRMARAGARAVGRFGRDPTWASYWREAERFTDEIEMMPADVRGLIRHARSDRFAIAQAMFGRLLVVAPRDLRPRGRINWPQLGLGTRSISVRVGARGAGPVPARRLRR